MSKVLVIGGGAAGFFSAINIAEKADVQVTIVEKSSKCLSKVKVSGGGRCNVTNVCSDANQLVKNYPRGGKKLKPLFKNFNTTDTVQWFEDRGVSIKAEKDGRMFPVSNSSQTIIDCFYKEAQKNGVEIRTSLGVNDFTKTENGFQVSFSDGSSELFDKVVIASGSSAAFWSMLEEKGIEVVEPVPSLFTFQIEDARLKGLQGIAFSDVEARIAGTKLMQTGPLLITHWGLSGPAIIKLSAWAARDLAECDYTFQVSINLSGKTYEECRGIIVDFKETNPKKKLGTAMPLELPKRYWERLLQIVDVPANKLWSELPKKANNRLVEELCNATFQVKGKTTFKEEFVTCGGVSLNDVNLETMESKKIEGLYFAGEVMNYDGITGGFNFQGAWATAWAVSESMQ